MGGRCSQAQEAVASGSGRDLLLPVAHSSIATSTQLFDCNRAERGLVDEPPPVLMPDMEMQLRVDIATKPEIPSMPLQGGEPGGVPTRSPCHLRAQAYGGRVDHAREGPTRPPSPAVMERAPCPSLRCIHVGVCPRRRCGCQKRCVLTSPHWGFLLRLVRRPSGLFSWSARSVGLTATLMRPVVTPQAWHCPALGVAESPMLRSTGPPEVDSEGSALSVVLTADQS
ncbi:unnamed protein product [Rangifer tarandus platyrhynchus]|uniref:Uncharacterized protein n=1 Tax=Rangifer tarandus platyrhynchus TaxID=3082113 RepID=A0AC59Z7D7_RANTA